ncbi:MAG: hypothetical protein IBX61_07450 [Thermoleophilia bacterium]|nr:hypothetical protein [Thermoleophilia bacterium]
MAQHVPAKIIFLGGTTYSVGAMLSEGADGWRLDFHTGGEPIELMQEAWQADRRLTVDVTAAEGFKSGEGRVEKVDRDSGEVTIRGLTPLSLSSSPRGRGPGR